MGLFSGFSRLTRNISRVFTDVAPIVAAVAPIVAPGFGGFIAGAIAEQFIQPGVVGARPVPAPINPCQAPAFSAPFQARMFTSGGSPSGRELANFNSFQPRSAVGRRVVDRCPPSGTCPTCPGTPVATVAQAPQLNPEQQAFLARFQRTNRFARPVPVNTQPGRFSSIGIGFA